MYHISITVCANGDLRNVFTGAS